MQLVLDRIKQGLEAVGKETPSEAHRTNSSSHESDSSTCSQVILSHPHT